MAQDRALNRAQYRALEALIVPHRVLQCPIGPYIGSYIMGPSKGQQDPFLAKRFVKKRPLGFLGPWSPSGKSHTTSFAGGRSLKLLVLVVTTRVQCKCSE